MKYLKKVKISVTKADIKKGKQRQPSSCPIALALKRVTGKVVTVGSVTVRTRKERVLAQLPNEAKEFVQRFDNDRAVGPFSFSIELDKRDIKK